MMIVIARMEVDERTGQQILVASHGEDVDTGCRVVLPAEHPADLGARFDRTIGEWVMRG